MPQYAEKKKQTKKTKTREMLKPPIGVSSGESKSSKRDNMVIFISLTS
jgi:hypothetical protein